MDRCRQAVYHATKSLTEAIVFVTGYRVYEGVGAHGIHGVDVWSLGCDADRYAKLRGNCIRRTEAAWSSVKI